MSKLLELSKKYGFKVTDISLVVPGTIETSDLQWLLAAGYHLTFNMDSSLGYIAAQEILKCKQKESDG
jgi:hypothetical protein